MSEDAWTEAQGIYQALTGNRGPWEPGDNPDLDEIASLVRAHQEAEAEAERYRAALEQISLGVCSAGCRHLARKELEGKGDE